jgi:hypothetical protein
MSSFISSLRLKCLGALGFEAFLPESLDDHEDLLAFMVPQSIHPDPALMMYLEGLIIELGRSCKSVQWMSGGTYENNWYGSRCHTHILGPHILFHVLKESSTHHSHPLPQLAHSWVIACVDVDAMKPKNSVIRYYTYLHEAAQPEEFDNVHTRLLREAKDITKLD